MIKAKLIGDKLPIPKNIIQKAGLKDGDEVEVRLEDGKVGPVGIAREDCLADSRHLEKRVGVLFLPLSDRSSLQLNDICISLGRHGQEWAPLA